MYEWKKGIITITLTKHIFNNIKSERNEVTQPMDILSKIACINSLDHFHFLMLSMHGYIILEVPKHHLVTNTDTSLCVSSTDRLIQQ